MILIQSQNFEIATNHVIDWLIVAGEKYIKFQNEDETFKFLSATLDHMGNVDFLIKLDGVDIRLNEIKGYWHRRGGTPLKLVESRKLPFFKKTLGKSNFRQALVNLNEERKHFSAFINFILTKTPIKIGNPNNSTLNKLVVLYHASRLGIKVSQTIVTTSRNELSKYYRENGDLITKSISDNLHTDSPIDAFMFYTEKITNESVNGLPPDFYYSLFQKKVEKKYEIRSFYLHGKFYSMAIFSQNDEQTEVDFRKYNHDKPNRMIPFKLPNEIEGKLTKLMDLLSLDSGSIDIIMSTTNEFYFLEINPVGQFGMVSLPCNYFIERDVANYLASGVIN